MDHTCLSQRLKMVSQYIPQGAVLADIGSDHAYLPTYLAQKGQIRKAIAGEINDGPYLSAKKQVQSSQCEDVVDVRKGDGLSIISKNEVDTVVIAGMGGRLITDILEAGKEKLPSDHTTLILQPNIGAVIIRNWLMVNHWNISHESILEEDDKIYEIIVAHQAEETIYLSPSELLFGPILIKEKSSAFLKKWKNELRKWEEIYLALTHATQTEETIIKQKEFLDKIQMAKQVIL